MNILLMSPILSCSLQTELKEIIQPLHNSKKQRRTHLYSRVVWFLYNIIGLYIKVKLPAYKLQSKFKLKIFYTLMNGVADLWNFSTIVTKVLMDTRETSLILVVRKSMWGLWIDMKLNNWIFKDCINSCIFQKKRKKTTIIYGLSKAIKEETNYLIDIYIVYT